MPGNCTSSTEELISANDLHVYPNPSSGKFKVEIIGEMDRKIEKAEVLDMLGRKIISLNVNSSAISIDIADQPEGVYILKIYSGESVALRKIIKAD